MDPERNGLVGREENYNEPNDREMKPLLLPTQPIYLKFRRGRETPTTAKCSELALNVFKVCFSLVGLWGHQAWNFTPRVLLGTVCLYQVCYLLYYDVIEKCRFDYRNETKEEKIANKHSNYTAHIEEALLILASVSSFLIFTGCFMVAKRKKSACVLPSLSMIDSIDGKITLMLSIFFLVTTLLLASQVGLLYNASIEIDLVEGSFCKHIIVTAIAIQFLLHWVVLNICNIFALSSLALGTFAKDALRLIQNLQNGSLDDVIRIHEDLCSIIFSTVSAYRVWFVLHWITYGASIPLAIIFLSRGLDLMPVLDQLHMGIYVLCLLYLFLLPSVCAARITSHCVGIYEDINHTTSDDWNEGHPFKDRRNIALFVSYAKERRCGFKIGKITFNASLAWVSFFIALTALLFHFF